MCSVQRALFVHIEVKEKGTHTFESCVCGAGNTWPSFSNSEKIIEPMTMTHSDRSAQFSSIFVSFELSHTVALAYASVAMTTATSDCECLLHFSPRTTFIFVIGEAGQLQRSQLKHKQPPTQLESVWRRFSARKWFPMRNETKCEKN